MTARSRVIDQTIDAGDQWDETVPPTTPAEALGIKTYPTAPNGGRFEWDFASADGGFETYIIERISVDFGDAAIAQIAIVGPGGFRVIRSAATGHVVIEGPLVLAWDEVIALLSVGATVAMRARVIAGPGQVRSLG